MPTDLWEQLCEDAGTNLQRGLSSYQEGGFSEAVVFAATGVELLVKSVLAHANPALLADPKHQKSLIWFATSSSLRRRPDTLRSISVTDAISLVKNLGHGSEWPDNDVQGLLNSRNKCVHLGGSIEAVEARDGLAGAVAASQLLLRALGVDLGKFFRGHRELADALVDDRQQEVRAILKDLMTKASKNEPRLPADAREELSDALQTQLEIRRNTPDDQIVQCPVCEFPAIVRGEMLFVEWDVDVKRGEVLSAHPIFEFSGGFFRCTTCELVLNRSDLIDASGVLEDWTIPDSDYHDMLAADELEASM